MKLSYKNIITIAILLASSLKTLAHPIELKGVEELIQEKEKVHNHLRDEEKTPNNIQPFASILDLACRSNNLDWCSNHSEQCSYVKTLCVRNDENDYCAFDIYKKYLLSTENSTKPITNYEDICNQCLIDMVEEFQNASNDVKAISEIRSFLNLCKVKSKMAASLKSKSNNNNLEHEKRNYNGNKIHSFKNPEGGFVKSNGKIEYGHVGINEKINSFIHNTNREDQALLKKNDESEQKEKRQEVEEVQEEEEIIILENIKEKISVALEIVKGLALQEVNGVIDNVEVDISEVNEEGEDSISKSETNDNHSDGILDNIKEFFNDFNKIVFEEKEEEEETETVVDPEIREIGTDTIEEVTNIIEGGGEEEVETEVVFNGKIREFGTDVLEEITDTVEEVGTEAVFNIGIREFGTDALEEEVTDTVEEVGTEVVFNIGIREFGTDALEEEVTDTIEEVGTEGVFNIGIREFGTDAFEEEVTDTVEEVGTEGVFNIGIREYETDALEEEVTDTVEEVGTEGVFNIEIREFGTDDIEEEEATNTVVEEEETEAIVDVKIREIEIETITNTVEEEEEEEIATGNVIEGELPPLPIIDIFENMSKKSVEKKEDEEKEDENVFNVVEEEANDDDVFIAEASVTESVEPTETSISEGEGEGEEEKEKENLPPSPPPLQQGKPPVVKPENPLIKLNKPSWPAKPSLFNPFHPFHPSNQKKPSKFGWPFKLNDYKRPFGPSGPHGPHGPNGPSTILQHINKILEENNNSRSADEVKEEVRHHPSSSSSSKSHSKHSKRELGYGMKNNWLMKKSKFVVNNEHFVEEMTNEHRTENNNVDNEKFHTHVIKINSVDNQRHNNEEEEVFEIGTKKVQWVNNAHPNKPSISFRKNNRDTH